MRIKQRPTNCDRLEPIITLTMNNEQRKNLTNSTPDPNFEITNRLELAISQFNHANNLRLFGPTDWLTGTETSSTGTFSLWNLRGWSVEAATAAAAPDLHLSRFSTQEQVCKLECNHATGQLGWAEMLAVASQSRSTTMRWEEDLFSSHYINSA